MQPTRRSVLAGLSAAAVPCMNQARAQNWHGGPITLVHGLPAGGSVDIIARLLANHLQARLNQSVVVEARPGAGGTSAAAQVARAAPDGSTLMVVPSGHAVSAAMYKKLPYDAVEDFTFIGSITEYPLVVIAHVENAATNLKELIAASQRDRPLLYGCPNGTIQHLTTELLAGQTGMKVQRVPYRGSPQAQIDLLGKRLDFMIDPPTAHMSPLKDGVLRALAVTGRKRFFALPDVPTISETLLPQFAVTSWQGLIGPPQMPAAMVATLNAEVQAFLKDSAVVQRLQDLGNAPFAGTPQEFKAQVASDVAKWIDVVNTAKIERV